MRTIVPLSIVALLAGCEAPQKFSVAPGIEDADRFGPDAELDAAAWAVGAIVPVSFDAFGERVVVETTDPGVASVGFTWVDEQTGQVGAFLGANAPGDAEIVARDPEGIEIDRVAIAVRDPVAAALHASGPLTLRLPEQDSLALEPRLLVDGVSSFEIRWYDAGGARLHAPANRSVSGSNGLWVETWTQYGRDWVRLIADGEGERPLTLRHGDAVLTTWTAVGVPPEGIATVALVDQDGDDDVRSFLGMARDDAGEPVWGTRFEWSVNGRPIETLGDTYRYVPDPDVEVDLTAAFGEADDTVSLRGTGGPVDSTALGCSVPLPFPGAAAIGLVAVFARRRRTTNPGPVAVS